MRADGHPAVEELVAYHRDELAGEARERLQDHLVLCKECARLLLDLENLVGLEPPSEAHRLSDDDVEEAKAALKARIRGETASPARLLRFHSSPPPKKG
ncbi:MAG TPA: hypothetical protein VGG06_26230 [Thermoanaerobaculia bacterium]